ncbi:MAG: DUF4234 domain-containing protein [Bacteroidetes bacterium]|nr:DUF4234 domain-containing protein [Bacteroidota bacterium]
MTKRSPIAVFFLSYLTLGIYIIVWRVKTKGEMCRFGADIPTSWCMIIPIVNIWWLWKYAGGVQQITKNSLSQAVSFILLFLLGGIGDAIVQDSFNKVDIQSVVHQ